ncbi:MAG TPA: hypothetical protein VH720_07180 [Candidatus Limnocylindrales bacterium]|jgi:hypothetical protein
MAHPDDDLRATTDSITADLKQLGQIEERKRELDASDPEAGRLAREAEILGDRIAGMTVAQREIVEEARAEA